jgi:hypothetical protein
LNHQEPMVSIFSINQRMVGVPKQWAMNRNSALM